MGLKYYHQNIPSLQSEGFIPASSWIVKDNTLWAATNGGTLAKGPNRGMTWDTLREMLLIQEAFIVH
ncbi:MAG: hypothetical protein U5J96_19710 [Ignavibacteriaceae bacterium]|nr:hypothetical protein [Ignavibacteriaceae bacterium]